MAILDLPFNVASNPGPISDAARPSSPVAFPASAAFMKHLRKRPRSTSPVEVVRTRNPTHAVEEELYDRCDYILQQHFNVEVSRTDAAPSAESRLLNNTFHNTHTRETTVHSAPISSRPAANEDNASVRSSRAPSERSFSSSTRRKRRLCHICGKSSALDANTLATCPSCHRCFHRGCHKPQIPAKDSTWRCYHCQRNSGAAAKQVQPTTLAPKERITSSPPRATIDDSTMSEEPIILHPQPPDPVAISTICSTTDKLTRARINTFEPTTTNLIFLKWSGVSEQSAQQLSLEPTSSELCAPNPVTGVEIPETQDGSPVTHFCESSARSITTNPHGVIEKPETPKGGASLMVITAWMKEASQHAPEHRLQVKGFCEWLIANRNLPRSCFPTLGFLFTKILFALCMCENSFVESSHADGGGSSLNRWWRVKTPETERPNEAEFGEIYRVDKRLARSVEMYARCLLDLAATAQSAEDGNKAHDRLKAQHVAQSNMASPEASEEYDPPEIVLGGNHQPSKTKDDDEVCEQDKHMRGGIASPPESLHTAHRVDDPIGPSAAALTTASIVPTTTESTEAPAHLARPPNAMMKDGSTQTTAETSAIPNDDVHAQAAALEYFTRATEIKYDVTCLLDTWPEYAPGYKTPTPEEIAARPTRKQMNGKAASESRLGDEALRRKMEAFLAALRRPTNDNTSRETSTDTSTNGTVNIESFEEAKEVETIEDLFNLPQMAIPMMVDSQLAFRDAGKTTTGRLARAKHIYKIGQAAKGP